MPEPATPDEAAAGGATPAGAGPDGRAVAPVDPPDLAPADLTPPDPTPAPDYDQHGTPSLDHVRDKIEGRYATSLGATELAEGTDAVREQARQEAERDRKAADRLEEIRRSMGR